jgi:uncharacterized protein (TIGR03437 family)
MIMLNRIALTLIAAQVMFAAVNYSYDAAGRLTKVDYGSAGSITYTYDKGGNLLSRNVAAGPTTGAVITSVNTSGSQPAAGITQNGWVEIKGNNLVPANAPAAGVFWSSAPEFAQGKMPTSIGGVSVTINGKPAYVYFYCSAVTSTCLSDQVNVLAPLDSTTGPVQIVVTNGATPSAPFTATLQPGVPSFFLFSANYVVATHANGTLLGPTTLYAGLSTPASRNETVVLYGTGFGLPSTPPVLGSSSQSGSLPTLPVCKIGTDNAPVAFAGLISPGLFQVNLTVPNTAATTGDRPITCTYNGATTPASDVITVNP